MRSNQTMDLERDGAEVIANVLAPDEIAALVTSLPTDVAGMRNVLARVPAVAQFARSQTVMALLRDRGYGEAMPVRAVFFDKNASRNWKVPWHQDLSIAVQERCNLPGFGPWSLKDGVAHVQPPIDVLERMVTVRVHLDECCERNGAVRVIPGSHREGRLSGVRLLERSRARAIVCDVPAGGVMLMKPLVLHASSPAAVPTHRRVIHIEYSPDQFPGGLCWHDAPTRSPLVNASGNRCAVR